MAYCPSCGTEMPDNARFCSQCGSAMQDEPKQAARQDAEESFEPGARRAPPMTPPAPTGDAAEAIWTGWPSRKRHIPMLALGLIVLAVPLIAAAVTGSALLLILSGLGLLWSLWEIARMLIEPINLRYWLTADRLFVRRGILRRTTDQTELIRVDDIRMHQGIVDRIFGIGNVEVDCESDITDAKLVLTGVDDPMRVGELIRTGMQTLRRARGVFIEKI
jgi:membrane protein YdbS with pleckstrin-like domain